MYIEMMLKLKLSYIGLERNHFFHEWNIWNIVAKLWKNVYVKYNNDTN
jgi:hypothetical protein